MRPICLVGRVNEEGGDLRPPPTSGVKKKSIKFSKKHIELRFVVSSDEPINPYTYHPTIESRWWWCILSVRLGQNCEGRVRGLVLMAIHVGGCPHG